MAGRPKSDNPKTLGYRLRLTEDENKMLDDLSALTGQQKSSILISALMRYCKDISYENDNFVSPVSGDSVLYALIVERSIRLIIMYI